jgi:hypothetical protein
METSTVQKTTESLEVIRQQLKDSLKLSGVFYSDSVAANIEAMIIGHMMRLIGESILLYESGKA